MIRVAILILAADLWAARLPAAEPATSAAVFAGNVLCIRAGHLTENFPEELRSLQPTNKIVGTVLDLRFADGEDAAVDAAVKVFAAKKIPLAMLVNGQTRGAAAALATRLRTADAGILIGSTNTPGIISADITVDVSAADEKKFLADPFAAPATNNEVPPAAQNELLEIVDHMSEAELVHRKIKDGADDGDEPLTPRVTPSQPVIRDPALARAVDLLTALAILKPARG